MKYATRFAVVVAVACGVVVGLASVASAHAVLLRTEPSPQSTVARAPTEVRLVFSESVEASLGSLRVFDVDGHRVDAGSVHHVRGRGSEVGVSTPHLKNGTFTVTWRVISADGHPVHGGFVFYLGAPSAISPVAITEEGGAGAVVGWGFGVVRFLVFAGFFVLIGTLAFRR